MRKRNLLTVLLMFGMISCLFSQDKSSRRNMIDMNKSEKNFEMKVGEKAFYEFDQHASIGRHGSYAISDKNVLSLLDQESKFENPDRPKGTTGGDKAKGTFIFQATSAGKTEVTVMQKFRSEIEKEEKFIITVK